MTTETSPDPTSERPAAARTRPTRGAIARTIVDRYAVLVAWAAIIVVFGILEPDTFLTTGILSAILGTQAVLLMLALAVMIPLAVGEFDLSRPPVRSASPTC